MSKERLVWIIDDDWAFQIIALNNLSKVGVSIQSRVFENGKEAADALLSSLQSNAMQNIPDAILLDINMPLYDGWYFLHRLKAIKSDFTFSTRVYLCSSTIDPSDLSQASENDLISMFLEKPVSVATLSSIML